MKTLIVYASKYGCTADCAERLKAKLEGDVTLLDIKKATSGMDLSKFDAVAIGGSVYVGKIAKPLRAFCESNLDVLIQKKVGIFLCCAQVDESDGFFAANFPASLLSHSRTTKVFGSEARLDKMGFADKMIIKAVTKGDFSGFKIFDEKIDEFASEISQ